MNRMISLRQTTLIAILTALVSFGSGWLARHDAQTVTAANVASDLAVIKQRQARQDNDIALTHAYVRSLHLWAVRISAKLGVAEPEEPSKFLDMRYQREHDGILIPNAMAEEERR